MRLSKKLTRYLRQLPAVAHVQPESGRIYYTSAFRAECMRRYRAGERPCDIFRDAGLGSDIIGYKRIERCIARWKQDEPGRSKTTPGRELDHHVASDEVLRRLDELERHVEDLERVLKEQEQH